MNDTRDNGTNSACESCVMGKQHRTPYPKGIPYRASEPFEIVHSDVLCMSIHLENRVTLLPLLMTIPDFTHVYFI